MKKVAILTWLNNGNYGSVLQAYALQSHIKEMGYDVEDIDYKASNKTKLINWFTSGNSPYLFISKIKEKFGKLESKEKIDFTKRNILFSEFKKKYIKTTPVYSSPKEIETIKDKYDIFVCGSDQIWSPKLLNPVFYFSFLPKESYKVAYAPSFGVSEITEKKKKEKIKKYLENFNAISVREDKGKEILFDLLKKDYPIQLDPTLLVNRQEWEKIAMNNNVSEKYIFCYLLTPNDKYIEKIRKIAEKQNLKVIINVTGVGPFNTGFEEVVDVGPAEWLGYIKDAEYIFTDSFHGCIFSMIYNKKFTIFKRFSDNNTWSQNSRIYNLAKKFEIEDRIADAETEINYNDAINYYNINNLIKEECQKSSDWLNEVLSNANK